MTLARTSRAICVVGLAISLPLGAQTAPTTTPQTAQPSISRPSAPANVAVVMPIIVPTVTPPAPQTEPSTGASYEDKLIGNGSLPAEPFDRDDFEYNAEGMPRYWRVEAVTSNVSGTGGTTHQNGLRFNGTLDTPDYGALTLDTTLQTGPGSSTFTLWQRGMPFDGGWRANNSLGVVNTLGIELSRAQYRFYLPTFPVAGVTTEWLRNGSLQLQASVGQPGAFDGLLISGFTSLHGSVATAGAQWAFAPQWRAGFQLTSSQDVDIGQGGVGPNTAFSGQSYYGVLAWQGANTKLQGNVLDSQPRQGKGGVGLWLDGETWIGRYVQHYGLFRLEPNLIWGYQQVNNDQQGAYYRVNYQSQQWMWDAGVDTLSSVSGRGATGSYGTGSVRYQVDRQIGLGISGSLRRDAGTAWSTQAFVDRQSSLGISRLQLTAAEQSNAQRGAQLMLDHSWQLGVGTRLTTGLTASRETIAGETFNTTGLLLYGGGDLSSNLTLDANLRFDYTRNRASGTGIFANVNMNWRIDSRWSVIATVYDNRDDTAKLYNVDPLIPNLSTISTQTARAFFLTLRYEDRAGSPAVPLGGAPGTGAGSVVGYLFLDANDNGRRDANETGASNVTVFLDGRFPARTDEQGRFEFPRVASGSHSLVVMPDNLPLPWSVANDGRITVEVHTRETTAVEIAAARLR